MLNISSPPSAPSVVEILGYGSQAANSLPVSGVENIGSFTLPTGGIGNKKLVVEFVAINSTAYTIELVLSSANNLGTGIVSAQGADVTFKAEIFKKEGAATALGRTSGSDEGAAYASYIDNSAVFDLTSADVVYLNIETFNSGGAPICDISWIAYLIGDA